MTPLDPFIEELRQKAQAGDTAARLALAELEGRLLPRAADPDNLPHIPNDPGDSDASVIEKLCEFLTELEPGQVLDQDDADGAHIASRLLRQLAAERLGENAQFHPPLGKVPRR